MSAPYETSRYKQHDELIKKIAEEFNRDKAKLIPCSEQQARSIPPLTVDLVKAWLIQETGGTDSRSLRAWLVDPAQANVPGDWEVEKSSLGLKKPTHRNEGTAALNMKAAVIYLARKGFGRSGRPPSADATFDGWETALRRYNGRTASTTNGKQYRVNYASQILKRSSDMSKWTPIDLPRPATGSDDDD